ncbi:MAG: cobalamin biosynthesis protein CobW [Pseudomonadales bacterium]|nr:cobalamin biosynthesis protein CobW [Pseudomonadales bacterium]
MKLNKIPATIVTGFLGSGKTTLLSNVLKQANGLRIAVIVNEFGELDIDSELLKSCPLDCDDDTTEQASNNGFYQLANGCICCTVEEEFLPVMKELMERRDDIDHILIETSGLALPKPLVQAFNWPEIKQHCTVDAVITVVDGPAVAAGRFAHSPSAVEAQREADDSLDHDPSLQELLDDQLSAANLVVISKNDCLDDASRDQVAMFVQDQIPSSVKCIYVENGEVDIQLLIGINAASEDKISHVHNHHDHHHAHGGHHEHAHDHFDSCVISLGVVETDTLINKLNMLIEKFDIYRVKGFAYIEGKPMRQVIQAVGNRIDQHFDRLWKADETKQTQLVFIGKGLDSQTIKTALS